MRLSIVFMILSSVIYLSNGQQSNSFGNPSFTSSNRPLNNHVSSYHQQYQPQQQSGGGTLSRIVSWFGRTKKQNKELDSLNNNSTPLKDDDSFSNSLPKESTTDLLINDAIADRILVESREQLTVVGSSPFVEDKNSKNSIIDHHQNKQITNDTVDREGYGKSVAVEANTIPITEALRIVNSSDLSNCVARVICELSCNANSYGPPGRIVFKNIIKLQFDQSLKNEDAKFFRQAASKGRQIVQAKGSCAKCFELYSTCKSSSEDLVAVSSMFKL